MKKGVGMLMKIKRFGFVPVIAIVLGITLIGLSGIDPGPALGWPGEPTPDEIVVRTPAPPPEMPTATPVSPEGASLSYCEVIVDDLDSGFARYGPSGGWYHSGSGDTTYEGHAYWTYCTDTWEGSGVNNWATWTVSLPETRQWEVFAYIPYVNTGRYDTGRARYQIQSADGYYVVERDQNNNTGWVSLGTYNFNAGTNYFVRLEDVTPDWYFIYYGQQYRKTIKFDAIKWSRCQAPGVSVSISVDRGEGAIYYVGDPIQVCYTVSRPVYVKIYDCPPGQSCYVILQGYDDGTGDCIYGTVTRPTGWETVRIEAIENSQVVAQDETYFFVTEDVDTEPPPGYCRVRWLEATSNECSGEFGLYSPQRIMFFSNYKYRPSPDVVQFGPFNPGTSLVFYIRPWSYCGPAEYLSTSANAHITELGTNHWRIDWEDLPPDRADDYNDLIVDVECGIQQPTPTFTPTPTRTPTPTPTRTPTPSLDFSISATPSLPSICVGGGSFYTVTVTGLSGFNSWVSLSVTGLPSGAEPWFENQSIRPGTTRLQICTPSSVTPGSYTINVVGASGSIQRSTTISLNVIARPAGDLAAPYCSQWDSDSGSCKSTNCGPASLAMVLQFYNFQNASTQEVRERANCGGCGELCDFTDLKRAALALRSSDVYSATTGADWTMNQLRGKIAAGNPVIVLVHYGDIPRWDRGWEGGHFLVVKGFTADGNSVIVHDPDYGANPNTRCQGANRVLPVGTFDTAWGDCTQDGNRNRQVLVVYCQGDANGDRVINALDLSILVSEWGRDCRQQPCRVDFNSDGTVNAVDLSILIANYYKRCS